MTDRQATDDQSNEQATDDQSNGQTTDDSVSEQSGTDTAEEDGPRTGDSTASIITYAQWAAFAILVLVALVATFRFYFATSNAINNFVTRQYRPIFQAVFNLVILLASGLGLSVLVRRIT